MCGAHHTVFYWFFAIVVHCTCPQHNGCGNFVCCLLIRWPDRMRIHSHIKFDTANYYCVFTHCRWTEMILKIQLSRFLFYCKCRHRIYLVWWECARNEQEILVNTMSRVGHKEWLIYDINCVRKRLNKSTERLWSMRGHRIKRHLCLTRAIFMWMPHGIGIGFARIKFGVDVTAHKMYPNCPLSVQPTQHKLIFTLSSYAQLKMNDFHSESTE